MNKTTLKLLIGAMILSLILITGCSSGKTETNSGQTQNPLVVSTSGNTTASGLLRNENWLLGTWQATVPKTGSSNFAGKKIKLNVTSVMLVSDEKVQGNPTGKFAYSGSIIWDVGGEEKTLDFVKEDWSAGNGTLMWGYASPGANQFVENITQRIYDLTLAFELDWGPQIFKPGSTFKSLGFFGSIQSLDTSDKDEFDPSHLITFTQTSSSAPATTSTKSSTAAAVISKTKPSSTTKTTATGQGTGNIWSDIPIYSNAQQAADEGFGLSIGSDPSYSQIEWRFFETSDDIAKVTAFYKAQMPAKGWAKVSWADIGEMSYGSFQKNKETRICLLYIVKSEGGTAINIESSAK